MQLSRIATISICLALAACGGDAAYSVNGELVGHVVLSAPDGVETSGIPAPGTVVSIDGTPYAVKTDENGLFRIPVPPGAWKMRLTTAGIYEGLPPRTFQAAANAGDITDMGTLVLYRPGGASGEVLPRESMDEFMYVAVPELGVAAAASEAGDFLVQGVAPGTRAFSLIAGNASQTVRAMIEPGTITQPVNFEMANMIVGAGTIFGTAAHEDNDDGGIEIQVKDAVTGNTVATNLVDAAGNFRVHDVPPGAYVVLARAEGADGAAFYPGVVVAEREEKELHFIVSRNAPAVSLFGPDPDGDGLPDLLDLDDDQNGIDIPPPPPATGGGGGGGVEYVHLASGDHGHVSPPCYEEEDYTLASGLYVGYGYGCDLTRAFFILRDIPVGSIKEAHLWLVDNDEYGGYDQTVDLRLAASGTALPYPGAEAAWHGFDDASLVQTFEEDGRGTQAILDVSDAVRAQVNAPGWRAGESDLMFYLGGGDYLSYDESKVRLMLVY